MAPHDALYRELTEAPGVPGQEAAVRDIMRRHLQPLGDIVADNLGSLVAKQRGQADDPRILVLGHMDEVGFMVRQITKEGYLRLQPLGGWWEQVMLAQRVSVQTQKGEIVGVVGSKPPHILPPDERKKPVPMKEMFIDVGAASREEAESFGVRPGDAVVPICPYTPMANPDLLMAKAWDNRAGCAIAIRVLEEMQAATHPNTLYAGASVQEEVGLRGAQTIGQHVRPDIGLALDVAIAGDTPGVRPEESEARLGEGPVLLLYDRSMVPHTGLRHFVLDTAKEIGVPMQTSLIPGGGTDAGRIHLIDAGVPSIALGVATRYIHSAAGVVHRRDLDHFVALLTALIGRLDADTVAALKRS